MKQTTHYLVVIKQMVWLLEGLKEWIENMKSASSLKVAALAHRDEIY